MSSNLDRISSGIQEEEIIVQHGMGTGYMPVLITKQRIQDLYGKLIKKEYYIRLDFYHIADKTNNYIKTEESEVIMVPSLEKICFPELWDGCCDDSLDRENKKKRSMILHRQAENMKFDEVVYVDQLGMVKSQAAVYVYCKGKVVPGNVENVRYYFSKDIPDFRLKGNISHDLQMECFKTIMKHRPGVLDLMFCVRLLSVLKPLLKESSCPESFLVMVYGEFGSGKTEYSKILFLADEMQLMNFTRDNTTPIKKKMEALNGHVLLLDDYHPAEQGHWIKKQKANLDLVTRFADRGDGALVVATGEYLEGTASLQDRMIPIYVEKSPGVTESIGRIRKMKAPLEELVCEFAMRVYRQKQSALEMIESFLGNWEINSQKFRIERNKNYLYLALCMFIHYFPDADYGGLDKQLEKSIRGIEERHMKHMQKVQRLANEEDWTDEVYHMLSESSIPREYEFSSKGMANPELVIKNKEIVITSMELSRRMNQYLEMRINVKKIAEHMDSAGVLNTDNSKARTKKVQGKYYYVIDRNALELYHKNKVDCQK